MGEGTFAFTLGILGSYEHHAIAEHINTYIGQEKCDYELIFSFDKKYCVPIHLINNVFLAHEFDIAKRVHLFENDDIGVLACAEKIIQYAKGKHILFLSIEDFFMHKDALKKMQKETDKSRDVFVFQTFMRGKSVCYPSEILKKLVFEEKDKCKDIVRLHRILGRKLKQKKILFYKQKEYLLARSIKKYITQSFRYYCDDRRMETAYVWEVKKQAVKTPLHYSSLSAMQIHKLIQLADKPKQMIRKEMCYVHCHTMDSKWGNSESIMQYLKLLTVFYKKTQKECIILKNKLQKMQRKIKIAFFAMEYSVWPSLKSVYEMSVRDGRFEVQLVYVPFFHPYSSVDHGKELECYKAHGYPVISSEEYDLAKEAPDVVIYVKPYDSVPEKYQVQEVEKIAGIIVYIPYGMEMGEWKESILMQCYQNMHYYADYILAFAPGYYEKCSKYTLKKGSNYLRIGHPRLDLKDYGECEDQEFLEKILKKAQNRKIVMWNTHFALYHGFLNFREAIFDYFEKNHNIFLLWRPHPLFYKSLAEKRGCPVEEVMQWMYSFNDRDNVMIDESRTYLTAFRISDALITDFSSFVPEYIAYQKPFLITHKDYLPSEFLMREQMDVAENGDDVVQFLDHIREETYDKKCIQSRLKCIYMPQTTVAQTLLNLLDQKIQDAQVSSPLE